MHVDPVNEDTGEYDLKTYSCKDHEDCLLYYNAVVRRFHFDSFDARVAELTRHSPVLASQGIQTQAVHTVHEDSGTVTIGTKHRGKQGALLAHDQVLAHAILGEWVERAMTDPDVNSGLDGAELKAHVGGILRRLDGVYRKTLSLSLCSHLAPFLPVSSFSSQSQQQRPWQDGRGGWGGRQQREQENPQRSALRHKGASGTARAKA